MGITVLIPSLAPRKKIKRIFLPLRPIWPSAKARCTNSGTEANEAMTAAKVLRLINDRRVITLGIIFVRLMFLVTRKGHKQGHHASHAPAVGGRRWRKL